MAKIAVLTKVFLGLMDLGRRKFSNRSRTPVAPITQAKTPPRCIIKVIPMTAIKLATPTVINLLSNLKSKIPAAK